MPLPPTSPIDAAFRQAFELHRTGRAAEAVPVYEQVIATAPDHVDALHLLGMLKAQGGDPATGERLIARALALKADVPMIWLNHGNTLALLGRRDEAVSSYDRALALAPGMTEARYARSGLLVSSGLAAEALADLASIPPDAPSRHMLVTARGTALLALGRFDEALAAYDAAVAAAPRNVDALSGRGKALMLLARPADALAAFDQALALVEGHLDSVLGRNHALVLLGRAAEALPIMDRVVAVIPANPIAHYIRGHARLFLFRTEEAAESFARAAELEPSMIEAVYNHADALRALGRHDEAIPVFDRVLAQDRGHAHALSGLAVAAMHCCAWDVQARIKPDIEAKVREGARGIAPFTFLSMSGSQSLQLACAQSFTRHTCPAPAEPLPRRPTPATAAPALPRTDRIRIGYLSSDFRRHAMAYQMVELFEVHDRARFEVLGFSGHPGDGSPVRQRIERAFDAFHELSHLGNEAIAREIHRLGVDVLVDLNGHTDRSRIGALAWRPAPAQATYLGFPGTSGAPFVDYVIADAIVAPLAEQPYFTERIVHLPGCYQVSDSLRRAAALVPRRSDVGLPEDAFVFCCFNASYKISARIFETWMRILKAAPGSVLWLVDGGASMVARLRREAEACGIEPTRLVFCGHVEPEHHLARHALADLYLDTLPYNSHGTGSFALWAGLPMLAARGPTFAGRVASSLLQAIDLSELVTTSLPEYEALAITLAADPARLAGLRARLAANRTTAPLFDTRSFCRHIEAAYETMHEIAQRGEAPRSFAIEPA